MRTRAVLPWTLTVVVTLAACEFGRQPTDPVANQITRVFVSPESVALDPQQTQSFQALGVTAAGDTVAATVTWSASAGSISSNGLYTADASPNDVTVTATLDGAQVTGSGRVRKRRLVQVVLTPSTTTVQTGGAQQFTAYGRRNTGDSVAVSVTYSATGGTMAANGTYSAGATPGAFRVIAREATTGLADTSPVTVTSTAPAPVASVSLSPASTSLLVGGVQQFTATLHDAGGNVLTGRTVTWSSSTSLLATVSGNGLATTLLAGVDTISATSEGITGSAILTITPVGTGGAVVFQSDWTSRTGLSATAISDGGRWQNYWEFNNGTGVQLLSVVDGASVNAPGGRNALKVLQRGSTLAANLQQANILPATTDYYLRYFMRNDDTSPAGDHVVTVDTWQYGNLLYTRKYSSAAGWTFTMGVYGCGYTYPIGYWTPPVTLAHGVWYRFEYYVHYVDPTHIQVHPRLYDAAGNLMYDDSGYQQSDPGSASWNGKSDWTLASYYAAGNSFCVDPAYMTTFGVGNNGQQGAVDTGLPWYFAGIQIRTDHWVGP